MINKGFIFFFFFACCSPQALASTGAEFPCEILASYIPDPGVAFQPGIDISGKPVAPADLNAVQTAIPKVIKVPVTIDLVEQLDTTADLPEGLELKADMALVEIYDNGRVKYNGQDISGDVYSLCAIDKRDKTEPDLNNKPAIITGQEK